MSYQPIVGSELPNSCLYTFVDGDAEFALHFLEGQRLIQELALLHAIRGGGFSYFRDVVLSIQPMIALLKQGEQLGFYIDSDRPYFRLKIETGQHGETRCMVLPEEFRDIPATMSGLVRLVKLFPQGRPPYESIIQADQLALRDLVNRVLAESYQVNSAIVVSQDSDQSLMLLQLPPAPGSDDWEYSPEALRIRRDKIREAVEQLFSRALHRPAEIEAGFADLGFRLIGRRPVRFRCSCSRANMVQNLRLVYAREGDGLFDPGQTELQVTCEYCKSRYEIRRDELEQRTERPN